MLVEYVGDDVPKIIHVPSHCGPSPLDRPFVTRNKAKAQTTTGQGPEETIASLQRAEERQSPEHDEGNFLFPRCKTFRYSIDPLLLRYQRAISTEGKFISLDIGDERR